MPTSQPVDLRVARASKVIGMPLTQMQCADALTRLGLSITQTDGKISVLPPSYRFDLQIEEDLIEEIARMVGYDNLPHTPPLAPITAKVRPEVQRSSFDLRRTAANMGYQETINFSFVEERWEHELAGNTVPIRLLNPIASQMSVMRSSLLGSLLQVVKFNLDRKAPRVRVFELGRVFLRDPSIQNTDTTVEGFNQPMRLAGMVCGSIDPLQWGGKERSADFFDVKGEVEALLSPQRVVFVVGEHPAMHPGRCASVMLNGVSIGFVGELHPRWRQSYELALAPVMFELDLDAVLNRPVPVFKPVSKYQDVERDIAVMVDESVTYDALMSAVWAAATDGVLRDAVLFDVYRPKLGKDSEMDAEPNRQKSMAVRLTLNTDEGTLTETQIEAVVQAVLTSLTTALAARQRS